MKKKTCYWGDIDTVSYPSLDTNETTKHVIIGGGITGLFTAYFLLKRGEKDIVLLEKNTIGSGSTGFSAGMLVCEPETASWLQIRKKYGTEIARAFWKLQLTAIRHIEKIAKEEHIACELLSTDLLILAQTAIERRHILRDFKGRKVIHHAVLLSGNTLKKELASDSFIFAERVQKNLALNPLLFAKGLGAYLQKHGVRIYEKTAVKKIQNNTVATQTHKIAFKKMYACRGVNDSQNKKIERFLTTIGITRPLKKQELNELNLADKDMLLTDSHRSYYYARVTADDRLLIGYGDLKLRYLPRNGYVHIPHSNRIKRFLNQTFKNTPLPIQHIWSAGYALSTSDIPYVKIEANTSIINGAGTQLASIAAASYAVAAMLEKDHPLEKMFRTQ